MMRRIGVGLAFAASLAGAVYLADTSVDQGKPGTQGSWPVAVVSGGWTPDGGFIGGLTGIQGIGADGGVAWDLTSTTIRGSARWRLRESFNVRDWVRIDGGVTTGARIVFGYPNDGGAFGAERIATTSPNPYGIRLADFPQPIMIAVTTYNSPLTIVARTYGYEDAPLIEMTAGQLAETPAISLAGSGTNTSLFASGTYILPTYDGTTATSQYGNVYVNSYNLRGVVTTIEATGTGVTSINGNQVIELWVFE